MYLKQKRKAFTLVELLVVMGIIVVLAAVTLPSIRTLLQGQKITQAARMVQAHVEAARARAIASQSYVAVVLDRTSFDTNDTKNTVTRLATGQVFPPYQGDVIGATGTLTDESGDGYYDRFTVLPLYANLVTSGTFGSGDFIQFADRKYTFVISAYTTGSGGTGVIDFVNPPRSGTTAMEEPQLPTTGASEVTFKVFRKPTKSFIQPSVLPRGTCVDLSVSGMGRTGNDFFNTTTSPGPIMIVFDERGSVSFLTDGVSTPGRPSGVIHLMCGRTEQVVATAVSNAASSTGQLPQRSDTDPASFNANINDTENVWISINPYSGAIYSSSVVAGDEGGTLANRIRAARSFATNSVTRSAN